MKRIEHWHIITALLLLYDIAAIAAAFFIALWVRFDCRVSAIEIRYLEFYLKTIPVYIVICIAVFTTLRLYKSIWRFASYNELYRVILATVVTFVLGTGMTLLMHCRMPISYYVFGTVLQFVAVLGIRFSYRFILLLRARRGDNREKTNIMVIGAGKSGQMLIRDIKTSEKLNGHVSCIIDDNSNKWGRFIEDVRIVGGRDSILESVEKFGINRIYFAIPSADARTKKEILDICKETGCELKTLPGIYELLSDQVNVSSLKDVDVEDLLGRDPIKVNLTEVFSQIQGKRVLVTGGGGSIGSEVCRQIAGHNPEMLVIFDIYENNAYDIQLELRNNYPNLNLKTIIGSVRDERKIWDVCSRFEPQLVYHAAAHKHVPLMEDSPCEAIKNNVIGTFNTAYAAMTHGCEKFVLISTDKAVNPTNIMGASKRLCEMVVQSFDTKVKAGKASEIPQMMMPWRDGTITSTDVSAELEDVKTEFVAVRFGNVLGSNGSVIPLFKKQIKNGGPVTVTHPDIIRYFMTIPEAVSLVLQAGCYANGGEIFVLDMGEPVKIDTLARNLIRLSGYKPDVDIEVKYVGLRPGEKLFEEKLMAEEGMQKTANDLIHIGNPIPFDVDSFFDSLVELDEAANKNKKDIVYRVAELVDTYKPAKVFE